MPFASPRKPYAFESAYLSRVGFDRVSHGTEASSPGVAERLRREVDRLRTEDEGMKVARKARVIDLDDFHKRTCARLRGRSHGGARSSRGREVSEQGVGAPLRRKIAIVGAGPVGLWTALLMARKNVQPVSASATQWADSLREAGLPWKDGTGMRSFSPRRRASPRPGGAEITVFEGRPCEKHGSRTGVRIALSSQTQRLLNYRAGSQAFESGMPLADIEKELLDSWRSFEPSANIVFGQTIVDPTVLCDEGYDCIFWVGGRRSLNDEIRHRLGCEMRTGDREWVLVFQLGELSGGDTKHLSCMDLSSYVQQESSCASLRVIFRPGVDGVCSCWVWLLGLPPSLTSKLATLPSSSPARSHPTMPDALARLLGNDAAETGCAHAAHVAASCLQRRFEPCDVSVKVVEAAFWSSDKSVCNLFPQKDINRVCPVVLVGDAACGRPFYTGSTLNRHFREVATLVDDIDWGQDVATPFQDRFGAHEQRYQAELRRSPEFRQQTQSVQSPRRPCVPPVAPAWSNF